MPRGGRYLPVAASVEARGNKSLLADEPDPPGKLGAPRREQPEHPEEDDCPRVRGRERVGIILIEFPENRHRILRMPGAPGHRSAVGQDVTERLACEPEQVGLARRGDLLLGTRS